MWSLRAESVSLHRAERLGDAALDALAGIERHDPPAPRHQIHQALERSFHRIEIFVDVGMVKLHRGRESTASGK